MERKKDGNTVINYLNPPKIHVTVISTKVVRDDVVARSVRTAAHIQRICTHSAGVTVATRGSLTIAKSIQIVRRVHPFISPRDRRDTVPHVFHVRSFPVSISNLCPDEYNGFCA